MSELISSRLSVEDLPPIHALCVFIDTIMARHIGQKANGQETKFLENLFIASVTSLPFAAVTVPREIRWCLHGINYSRIWTHSLFGVDTTGILISVNWITAMKDTYRSISTSMSTN